MTFHNRQSLFVELENEEAEKRAQLADIEQQIRERSDILANYEQTYATRLEELDQIDQAFADIVERIESENDLVTTYVVLGMTRLEVETVLGQSIQLVQSYNFSVYSPLRSERSLRDFASAAQIGDFLIVFSETQRVMGYYDTVRRQVYHPATP
jgi:chromosome segregation ATPase